MMRTTVTLDDDVAAHLERLRTSRQSWKSLINDTLRRGLADLERVAPHTSGPFTDPDALGDLLIDVTDVSEALALAEGEDYR